MKWAFYLWLGVGAAFVAFLCAPIWPQTLVTRGHVYTKNPNPAGPSVLLDGGWEETHTNRVPFWKSDICPGREVIAGNPVVAASAVVTLYFVVGCAVAYLLRTTFRVSLPPEPPDWQ